MLIYRTLTKDDLPSIVETFAEAYSDYFFNINITSDFLRRKFIIEGVNFENSVGVFDGCKMVGFTMNALGNWQGKSTVYDSGTGIIPSYRKKGIATEMFEYILPILKQKGFEQYLLEVITKNIVAVNLYKNLGFKVQREFRVFQAKSRLEQNGGVQDIEIREVRNIDWNLTKTFWTFSPAWQNTIEAIERSYSGVRSSFLGVFIKNKFVGYGVVFHGSGRIPQIAIDKCFRKKGIGRLLLNELQKHTKKSLFLTNIDTKAEDFIAFAKINNFQCLTSQYEMLKRI